MYLITVSQPLGQKIHNSWRWRDEIDVGFNRATAPISNAKKSRRVQCFVIMYQHGHLTERKFLWDYMMVHFDCQSLVWNVIGQLAVELFHQIPPQNVVCRFTIYCSLESLTEGISLLRLYHNAIENARQHHAFHLFSPDRRRRVCRCRWP